MSPEIVLKRKHNNKADIWCLGIFLYEMLHGNPPFEAEDLNGITSQLRNVNIMIRDDLHPDTKAILQYMLKVSENQRYSIDQVLSHPCITSNLAELKGPMKPEFISILMRNYILNNGENVMREMPQVFQKLIAQNPSLKQNSELGTLKKLKEYVNQQCPRELVGKTRKLINLNCQIPNKTNIVQEFDYQKFLETGQISFAKKKAEIQHNVDTTKIVTVPGEGNAKKQDQQIAPEQVQTPRE